MFNLLSITQLKSKRCLQTISDNLKMSPVSKLIFLTKLTEYTTDAILIYVNYTALCAKKVVPTFQHRYTTITTQVAIQLTSTEKHYA